MESLLHVAQFAALLVFLLAVMLIEADYVALMVAAAAVVSHTTLAVIDVSYTDGRRRISPFEQWVHGYMDVLPLVALALIVILRWGDNGLPLGPRATLTMLGSYVFLAGIPIAEELLRTIQRRRRRIVAAAHGVYTSAT
jgi:hypothetical protein